MLSDFTKIFKSWGKIFISRKTERFGKYHGHLAYITDLHLEIKTEAPWNSHFRLEVGQVVNGKELTWSHYPGPTVKEISPKNWKISCDLHIFASLNFLSSIKTLLIEEAKCSNLLFRTANWNPKILNLLEKNQSLQNFQMSNEFIYSTSNIHLAQKKNNLLHFLLYLPQLCWIRTSFTTRGVTWMIWSALSQNSLVRTI